MINSAGECLYCERYLVESPQLGSRGRKIVSATLFYERGWCRFDYDAVVAAWAKRVLHASRASVKSDDNSCWLRCGGTWFVGVNALPNNTEGAIGDSGPLRGSVVEFIRDELKLTDFHWDRAQVSVCYPGYPKPMAMESASAFRFRRQRDAAHVDGLLPQGPLRRRHLREYHGFILGLPLLEYDARASPFVVWEGSHELIRSALLERFEGLPPEQWCNEDITDVYHQARRRVFQTCQRVEISARPGEAYVAHRLIVHGVAPWPDTVRAGADGRMICYFRPDLGDPQQWLVGP